MKLNRRQLRRLIESAIVDFEGQSSVNSSTHAKDMQADEDLWTLDEKGQELITVPAGQSVKFRAKFLPYGNSIEIPEEENTFNPDGHKKLVLKVDNSSLQVTDDEHGFGFSVPEYMNDEPDKLRTFYIKNHGSKPVVIRYDFGR
jgi:hypothetical protein